MYERGAIWKGILLSIVISVSWDLSADEHIQDPGGLDLNTGEELLDRDFIVYPASFFDLFRPVTAADMVTQVPGFQLDEDSRNEVRGFSESAGNILIDGRRPSTKRDSLTNILSRIPASTVERVELIRREVRGLDMRGRSSVVNLVLREGIPAAIQWEMAVVHTLELGSPRPHANISLSDTWGGVAFNAGLRGELDRAGRLGNEDIFDSDGAILENRTEERHDRYKLLIASVNASSWLGSTFIQINTNYNYSSRHLITHSDRFNWQTDSGRNFLFDNNEWKSTYEAGFDLERVLLPGLLAKGIFMHVRGIEDIGDTQVNRDSNGIQTLYREAPGRLHVNETIARLEVDWNALKDHQVQINMERAYNVLDSSLQQTDDTGTGPVLIEVPGANSRVEEVRWDFQVKDTWVLQQFKLEYGLGAEASTISQTGDATLERDFFFFKPQAILSYSPNNSDHTRLRLAREISQLDLDDFVSTTVLLDDDLALGNPNIRPDSTWKLELSQEKRFGGDAVVKLTAYHNWISDVLDWLPVTPEFEVPGNIGDGRRWGILFESTLPLDRIGLMAAKLDIKFRWQDSSVIDPVTGRNRRLSFSGVYAGAVLFNVENSYGLDINYRQDFQRQQVAWGWHLGERARQELYKVNELEHYNEGVDFNAFIETTRWLGIKTRLTGENLLDLTDIRDRRIYSGERDLSPLATRQYRNRTRGRGIQLSFSGNF